MRGTLVIVPLCCTSGYFKLAQRVRNSCASKDQFGSGPGSCQNLPGGERKTRGRFRGPFHSVLDQCGAVPCFEAEALDDKAQQDLQIMFVSLDVETAEKRLNDNEMAAVEVTQTAEL